MKRRRLFRFIAYTLLGVLVIFLLILYSIYLSSQRSPDFYREALAVVEEIQVVQNKGMLDKVRVLNNDVQKTETPWQGSFTDDEINAYLAVECTKPGADLIPREVQSPRIAIAPGRIDLACRLEQGAFSGILHVAFSANLPEPNRLALRIREARFGKLPVSRTRSAKLLREFLEKNGYPVVESAEGGDPTLSFPLKLKYGKDKSIRLEEIVLRDGEILFSGTTEKNRE